MHYAGMCRDGWVLDPTCEDGRLVGLYQCCAATGSDWSTNFNHNNVVYQYRSGLQCTGALCTFSYTVLTNQRAGCGAPVP